jgi:hypothetical protein
MFNALILRPLAGAKARAVAPALVDGVSLRKVIDRCGDAFSRVFHWRAGTQRCASALTGSIDV